MTKTIPVQCRLELSDAVALLAESLGVDPDTFALTDDADAFLYLTEVTPVRAKAPRKRKAAS